MGKEVLTCFVVWCGYPGVGSLLQWICGGSGSGKWLGRSGCISGGLRWPEVWEFQRFVGGVYSKKITEMGASSFNGEEKMFLYGCMD